MTTHPASAPDEGLAAATIYYGPIMHARIRPFVHRFQYKVFSFLIDIDRLDEVNRRSPLMSVNRPNLVSFYETDHIDERISGPALGLRAYVDALIATAHIPAPARVFLLAYPRVFGHAFNPISAYFCYGASGELVAMIYEVRNTFGERHSYVCPVQAGELTASGLRQWRQKKLHVSPFMEMQAQYAFRVTPPGNELRLRILEHDASGPLLAATFKGDAHPLNTRNLIAKAVQVPLLGMKVVTLIHFEALRLWLKGAIFRRSPAPPPPSSTTANATAGNPGD